MHTEAATQLLSSLDPKRVKRYERYFDTIKPTSSEDIFRRWLFAYASVHTSWRYNAILYNQLKDLSWLGDADALKARIIASRAGLCNNRTRYIHTFSEFFWGHPGWFIKSSLESWFQYRDRLMEHTLGLGIAKSSFAVELLYFHDAGCVCFDTHQLQLYGMTSKDIQTKGYKLKDVRAMEQHWLEECAKHGVAPVTARWIYFDKRQKQRNPRYWSHVLDEQPYVGTPLMGVAA